MTKKKENPDEGPQQVAEGAAKQHENSAEEQASVSASGQGKDGPDKGERFSMKTTEGRNIDSIKVKMDAAGAPYVSGQYGRKIENPQEGQKVRDNMRDLPKIPLTPEQSAEFQRLHVTDPKAAKEYVVREAYPMFLDDKSYHLNPTQGEDGKMHITPFEHKGQKFDYVTLELVDKKDREGNVVTNSKGNPVKVFEMGVGEKGNKDSRRFGQLNDVESALIQNRRYIREEDGVKLPGKPVTLADIAKSFMSRIERAAVMKDIKAVDWEKCKLPEGIKLEGARWTNSSKPDQAWLNGRINGVELSGVLLSKEETLALKTGNITFEQALMHNETGRDRVEGILHPAVAEKNEASRAESQEQAKGLSR